MPCCDSYVAAVFYTRCLEFLGFHGACQSPLALRSLNGLLGLAGLAAAYDVLTQLYPTRSTSELRERAVALVLLPFNFFFWFLFYTDPGSVFFVLAAYGASLRGRDRAAAALGAAATGFRQNNIVWVALLLGWRVLEDPPVYRKGSAMGEQIIQLLKHVVWRLWEIGVRAPALVFPVHCASPDREWQVPYLLVLIAFLAFVAVNGSIVVGDAGAHQAP